jgi:hypothetical protein
MFLRGLSARRLRAGTTERNRGIGLTRRTRTSPSLAKHAPACGARWWRRFSGLQITGPRAMAELRKDAPAKTRPRCRHGALAMVGPGRPVPGVAEASRSPSSAA